jgi:ethanolamine utilization protein EutP
VVTKIDHPLANVEQATEWLRLAGCKKVFPVCSLDGQGLTEILDYLAIPGERISWEEAKRRTEGLSFRRKGQDAKDYDYQITVI